MPNAGLIPIKQNTFFHQGYILFANSSVQFNQSEMFTAYLCRLYEHNANPDAILLTKKPAHF